MKIATWNIERLKYRKSIDKILSAIENAKADILVLTESDERIKPNYRYAFHTPKLYDAPSEYRMPGRYNLDSRKHDDDKSFMNSVKY